MAGAASTPPAGAPMRAGETPAHPGAPVAPGQGYWTLVWRQFRKNRIALASGVMVIFLFVLAAWAPVLANGKPFFWTENGATSYPLFQYLVAPTQGPSVDYLFNYFLFLTLTLPLMSALFAFASRGRVRTEQAAVRRAGWLLAAAGALAALPFLDPGIQERSANAAERAAQPDRERVAELRIVRRWKLDAREYLADRAGLDPARGERAWFPPLAQDPVTPSREVLQPPSAVHWLGTDRDGRDVLTRMLHGARISMSVGFVAVGISILIGILIGGLAGYYRGWVDLLISRLIELLICFPTFFLIITLIAFIEERSIFHIMLIIGFTGWTGVARLVRGEFLKLAEQDFVHAARALGCSGRRIMFRHILPNALGPVLVSAAFGIASAVLTESSLSYLGFGAPPPTPTWGEMISQGKTHIDEAYWLLFFPGISIFLTVTVYNLAGEGMRDAMDPKLRK